MTDPGRVVFGGADTHRDTIHLAVVDEALRPVADLEVPTTTAGYTKAVAFLRGYGELAAVGVEGTSSYGAGLTEFLHRHAITVVEVDQPDRAGRRRRGKSDQLDAYSAATAAATGRARTVPKTRTGPVETIRVLRIARASAIKARTQTINQIKNLLVTAPTALREQLRPHSGADLIASCARLRPNSDPTALTDPTTGTKRALRSLARRYQHLDTEIGELEHTLAALTAATAPTLSATYCVGPDVAGQLLTTAGDNPHRITTEAAFANLCAAAPIPASSGQTQRHRLNRGGDRQANRALYTVVLSRLRHDPATQAYRDRRKAEGRTTKEIIRCLKRYVARELYHALTHDLAALDTP